MLLPLNDFSSAQSFTFLLSTTCMFTSTSDFCSYLQRLEQSCVGLHNAQPEFEGPLTPRVVVFTVCPDVAGCPLRVGIPATRGSAVLCESIGAIVTVTVSVVR